jgi:hypothetical protein
MPWYEMPANPNWKLPPNTHSDRDTMPEVKRQERKQNQKQSVPDMKPRQIKKSGRR